MMQDKHVLDSWKEIAVYLSRTIKTCHRWENELDLPIRRLDGSPKARVFAYKEELDLWLKEKLNERELPLKKPFFFTIKSKKLFIPALTLIAVVIIGLIAWQILSQGKSDLLPSDMPSIAVVSFENHTGDNSYNYLNKVIPNLLITNLEQSGYFYVASSERLYALLKQMGKEDLEVIDSDLGFELCHMDDIDAIVTGSFAKAGEMFITDIKVLDVETKRILKSANSRGEGEESIIQSQIDELSKEISRGVGISETRIEKTPMLIADVTTDSLDAYVYYVRGKECIANLDFKNAVKFLEKAVELDPNFAMAYVKLREPYNRTIVMGAGDEAIKKAKKFSARATEKERLYIEGLYALRIEKDSDKGFRIFNKMVELYPKEKSSHYGLALAYSAKRLFNQALEEFNKALELDPYDGTTIHAMDLTYGILRNYEKQLEYLERYLTVSPRNAEALEWMSIAYFDMGKFDESIAKGQEALEANPDYHIDYFYSYIYALREDYTEAMRWIDFSADKATNIRFKEWLYLVKSFYQYWLGSLDKSMSSLRRQIDSSNSEWEANANWMMGWISLDRDEFELSRKHFKSWFEISMQDPNWWEYSAEIPHWNAWYYFYLGLVDVKQGKIESAKSRLGEINSLLPDVHPNFKNWRKFYYNFLQAEILLVAGAVDKVITLCEKSFPLGGRVESGNLVYPNVPFLKDVLARAYRQNGEIDKAIAEYKRLIVFDPQGEERYLIHPKYYYRLAQLYEQKGLKMNAIEHYEKFLDLWKDADPGMAEVEDAKKRLAKLKI